MVVITLLFIKMSLFLQFPEKYLHSFSPQAAARLVMFDPESLGVPSPIVQTGVMTEL